MTSKPKVPKEGANGNGKSRNGDNPDPGKEPRDTLAARSELAAPLFRGIDWLAFGVTTALVFAVYFYTLAPDLTLEDSGELAVASAYLGVPHPPGYPVWTVYSWLFTQLLPYANFAYRVGISSAVAGALACGLVALLIARGSSMLIRSMPGLQNLSLSGERWICLMAGYAGGMVMGCNGFLWSQSVIVEVYSLSLLSFMITLAWMFRWIHAPDRMRYLYLAIFMFGICFTNHQSLLLAAMGLEALVVLACPRLGRDLLAANGVIYLLGLGLRATGHLQTLASVPGQVNMMFLLFNLVGVSSLVALAWMALQTRQILSEWKRVLAVGGAFILGNSFYLLMPLFSMANPPMNWGYARTVEGFMHALTRGQYDKVTPTNILSDPSRFARQLWDYLGGMANEFSLAMLLVALIPFVVLGVVMWREGARSQGRRLGWLAAGMVAAFAMAWLTAEAGWSGCTNLFWAVLGILGLGLLVQLLKLLAEYGRPTPRIWLAGLSVIYLCLSVLLVIMLNPSSDRQSLELNRVFLASSHAVVALLAGYAMALAAAALVADAQRFQRVGIRGALLVCALAAFGAWAVYGDGTAVRDPESWLSVLLPAATKSPTQRFAANLGLVIALLALGTAVWARSRWVLAGVVLVYALLPWRSAWAHWEDNEQRGHRFGYWFGHDMFTPPFKDAAGAALYPAMARQAILFGGTDPGRFCPTYMIFCESSLAPKHKPGDPGFDRRDVSIITQNALADPTYLNYIRAHYQRTAQVDPPFFQEVFRSTNETARNYRTNLLAKIVSPLDHGFMELGTRIEQARRAAGLYPHGEIHIPTPAEFNQCYQEYLNDVQRRMENHQLRPGEDVRVVEGRMQVTGQVAVMAINALLAKVIFEQNPDREFYVEESFPLEWMYPYLEPHGIIMKLNRHPLPALPSQVIARDHDFWCQYSNRLVGDWIREETSVNEICQWAERVYFQRDHTGFKGDPRFLRDDDAQKAFSKLRTAIGGMYAWRAFQARSPEDQQRMIREAEFAYKQALAFCPYSPEVVSRYVNLLLSLNQPARVAEAQQIVSTCRKLDPGNLHMAEVARRLEEIKNRQVPRGNAG